MGHRGCFPPEFIENAREGHNLVAPVEYASNGFWIELHLTPLGEGSQVIGMREGQQQALGRERAAREQAEAASAEIRSVLERIGMPTSRSIPSGGTPTSIGEPRNWRRSPRPN